MCVRDRGGGEKKGESGVRGRKGARARGTERDQANG